tara:strand:+ start:2009 stop:2944 length:936 start_codon:yes stop_codon:yes gene_type:complete
MDQETQKIINLVQSKAIKNTNDWVENLSERKKEEVELHDKLRDMNFRKNAEDKDVNTYFSNTKMVDGFDKDGNSLFTNNELWFDDNYLLENSISGLSDTYFNNLISESSKNKIVLDMACGFGRESLISAKSGARLVVGIDLSPKSVEEATLMAKNSNLENVIFAVADCENLFFEDETFDCVVCARMLHHIKFEKVMKELNRVLKPGGKIICIEALGINPLLSLYRKLTPAQRTHWETANILTFKHIGMARKYFSVENIKYWHLLSPLAKFSKKLLPLLNFLDQKLLTRIPIFNRLSWTFTFQLRKVNSLPK